MATDFELFPGKDLSGLFKDIYTNQQKRKKSISELIAEIRHAIRGAGDWAVMGPVIKDLVDTSVKNDDSLLKLATIAQKIISASSNNEGEVGLLTDAEKQQLLEEVETAVNNLATEIDEKEEKVDELTFEVETIKQKIKKADESKSKNITTIE